MKQLKALYFYTLIDIFKNDSEKMKVIWKKIYYYKLISYFPEKEIESKLKRLPKDIVSIVHSYTNLRDEKNFLESLKR